MATKITTGFSYNGKDPIDGPRSKFSSISEMKNYNKDFIDEGHMSVTNIGTTQAPVWKRFEWFSANTDDPTYGKWRAVATEVPAASNSALGGIKIAPQSGSLVDTWQHKFVRTDSNNYAYIELKVASSSAAGVVVIVTSGTAASNIGNDVNVPTVKAVYTLINSSVSSSINAAVPSAVTTAINNKMWFGTKAQYDALATKDSNVLYFVTY